MNGTLLKILFQEVVKFSYKSFFLTMAQQPPVGQGLLSIEDTSHSVGLLWTSDQPDAGPLPDNTQHSQETDIYAPGGIRTHNPSKRAAAKPTL